MAPGVAAEQARRSAGVGNAEIADVLDRVADLLEAQDANRYRVNAYRRAAATVRAQPTPLAELLRRGGLEALEALPTIGKTMAAHVAELVEAGGLTFLDRLEGEVSPERLLGTLSGIGPELARRVHEELHVETLEDLEQAAHDGRLATVPGFGPRRIRSLRDQLGALLGRAARQRARRARRREAQTGPETPPRPSVADLLAIDAEYRERAGRGELRRIAPRRFNPEHRAWLPILHAQRGDWHVTALFSNTARAHELGRTRDWVVLFYERDGDSGQCTVVTEMRGPLRGQRVVRGREPECQRCYGVGEAPRERPPDGT